MEFIEKTDYPFDESIHFTYKNNGPKLVFPLYLRIPGWCNEAEVALNGKRIRSAKGGQVIKIDSSWENNDEVTLTLPMHISFGRWSENSIDVERGPLVYALKIEEDWKKITNNDRYGDYYEVYPRSPWNYGLVLPREEWQKAFKVEKKQTVSADPWNPANAPIALKVMGIRLPDWQLYNGSAGPLPYSPQPMPSGQKPEPVTLIPYGCTRLRISEFPVVE